MIIPKQLQNSVNQSIPAFTEQLMQLIKGAIPYMRGKHRRAYMAEVTEELLDGNARQAERVFGWGRGTV